MAIEQPAWGQVRVSEALKRRGLSISPAGVRCVWQRHELTSMKLRPKALEANVAQDGILLTEAQIVALEKPRPTRRRMASSRASARAIAGRRTPSMSAPWIYQQTVVDTHAKGLSENDRIDV
jgi:hypothetical protein